MPPISLPPISIELALLVGRALFLVFCFVLAAVAFTRWRRAADRNSELFMQQTALVLERIAALETRIESLQTAQSSLAEKVSCLSTIGAGPSSAPSYQVAIRMARTGATREDLMSSCGITRQEAELLQRLHAPAARTRIAAVS
jgi:hypothetical protein